jgi:SAM-dependent methyltransferase
MPVADTHRHEDRYTVPLHRRYTSLPGFGHAQDLTMHPTERFTSRVDSYVRYRPSYPAAALDLLKDRCGLSAASRVADVGSGTGLFTRRLLETGAQVWGIEPNDAMRAAAERFLGDHERFHSVAGTAEACMLPAASVDLVTAAQAFHWFDVARARAEFGRILIPGGWVALVWNERPRRAGAFLDEYRQLLLNHCSEYHESLRARGESRESALALLGRAVQQASFPNPQSLGLEAVVGRLLSASYAPQPGHPEHERVIAELRELFARHQRDGQVVYDYQTWVYFGQLR